MRLLSTVFAAFFATYVRAQGVPGVVGYYWSNPDLSGTPVGPVVSDIINFNWTAGGPAVLGGQTEGFSARWIGSLNHNGDHIVCAIVTPNSGARMWINDVQLLDNWTASTATDLCDDGYVNFPHFRPEDGRVNVFRMEFFHLAGPAAVAFKWLHRTGPLSLANNSRGGPPVFDQDYYDAATPVGLEFWLDAKDAADNGYSASSASGIRPPHEPALSFLPAASQPVAAQAPTVRGGNSAAFVFDSGDNQFLSVSSGFDDFSAGFSAFAVLRWTAESSSHVRIFDLGNANTFDAIYLGRGPAPSGTGHVVEYGSGGTVITWPDIGGSDNVLYSVVHYRNGTVVATVNNGVTSAVHSFAGVPAPTSTLRTLNSVGRSYAGGTTAGMDLAQLLIYSTAVDAVASLQTAKLASSFLGPGSGSAAGDEAGQNLGLLIGVPVAGGVLLIAIVVVVALLLVRRRRRQRQYNLPELEGSSGPYNMRRSVPAVGSPRGSLTPEQQQYGTGGSGGSTPAAPIYQEVDNWRIHYPDLRIGKELGRGAFGVVFKARWRNSDCVVKQMLADPVKNVGEYQLFLKEAEQLRTLRPHHNLVQMLGVCLNPDFPMCIVFEFVELGSLESKLQDPSESFPVETCIELLTDVSAGMTHLHSEGVLHCDLAARNVLLSPHSRKRFVAKLSDFGMSHKLNSNTYYAVSSSARVPVRWSAPELLSQHKFSKETDVWSFGVVCYEVFERKVPYYVLQSNEDVISNVCDNGLRLARPTRVQVPDVVWNVMNGCFSEPFDRPTFEDINRVFKYLIRSDSDFDLSHSGSAPAGVYGVPTTGVGGAIYSKSPRTMSPTNSDPTPLYVYSGIKSRAGSESLAASDAAGPGSHSTSNGGGSDGSSASGHSSTAGSSAAASVPGSDGDRIYTAPVSGLTPRSRSNSRGTAPPPQLTPRSAAAAAASAVDGATRSRSGSTTTPTTTAGERQHETHQPEQQHQHQHQQHSKPKLSPRNGDLPPAAGDPAIYGVIKPDRREGELHRRPAKEPVEPDGSTTDDDSDYVFRDGAGSRLPSSIHLNEDTSRA